MKKDIHPAYKEVVFLDMSTGKKYLCRSTVKANDTIDFEGKTYPCCKVSISSSSHPYFTGDTRLVDTEGRVDKFKKRYAAKPVESAMKDAEEEKKKSPPKKVVPAKKAASAKKPEVVKITAIKKGKES